MKTLNELTGWLARESGIRFLVRRRGAAAVAILTLALALGGNALVLALGRSFLASQFGMPDPERLFLVAPVRELPGRGEVVFAEAYPNYRMVRETARSFEDVAVLFAATAAWDPGDGPESLNLARVSASFFSTTRARPVLGRGFTEEEEGPQAARVVVLSENLWRTRFGADRNVLGGTMQIDGSAHTIVGVMPRGFVYPLRTDVWVPFDLTSELAWTRITGGRSLTVYGRLRDGVSVESARAEMAELTARGVEASPDNREFRYTLQTIRDVMVPNAARVIGFVQIGAALLVLLAVANLASLLIAWGFDRRQEIAVRLALGAGTARVLRMLIVQSVVVVALGGLLGLLGAWLMVPVVKQFPVAPAFRFYLDELRIDMAVVTALALVIGVAGVLAGMVPALLIRHGRLGDSLRAGGRGSTLSPNAIRWQKAMVLAQTSLAVVIVAAAAIVMVSLRNLSRVPIGFDPESRVVARIQLGDRYPGHPERAEFGARLLENLQRQPELEAAAFTSTLPVGDIIWGGRIFADPSEQAAGREPLLIHFRRVSQNYLETIGIPVAEGRSFDTRDHGEGAKVAVISRSLARRLWPDQPAVGKRIYRVAGETLQETEVIGVAGDVQDAGQSAPAGETVYVPWPQVSHTNISIIARTSASRAAAQAAIDRAVAATDGLMATNNPAALEVLVDQANALPRFQTVLLSVFAAIALMLLLLGSYGVITQLVASREREFALRMFFGAAPVKLGGMVFGQVVVLGVFGALGGGACVWLLASTIEPLVFGVVPRSPALLGGAAAVVLTLALLAAVAPALRAMRLDVRRATQP